MSKTNTPQSQLAIVITGGVILTVAVAGALYFLVQLEMPILLAVVIGLIVAALAIGRFYLVTKHQLF
ncbi:hypothetical protein ACFFQF_33540 [Haladaptatus pallidirubidus]|uniref:Uncharacterized protein n=1 Tax=Haladaptatus pallidirubidus TaxID=1008152 RepID=A0AAV3UQ93_9EURY|nr:hypothetical protein [Haladaptatus pallidirubidus]